MCTRHLGSAARIKGSAQVSELHSTQPGDQQSLRLRKRLRQRLVDSRLNRAIRIGMLAADSKDAWSSYRSMYVEERHGLQVCRDGPTATMPFFRAHIPCLAQTSHRASDDNGIGSQHLCDSFGRHCPLMPRHMEQHVEHSRKATVITHISILRIPAGLASIMFHDTYYVT